MLPTALLLPNKTGSHVAPFTFFSSISSRQHDLLKQVPPPSDAGGSPLAVKGSGFSLGPSVALSTFLWPLRNNCGFAVCVGLW